MDIRTRKQIIQILRDSRREYIGNKDAGDYSEEDAGKILDLLDADILAILERIGNTWTRIANCLEGIAFGLRK